MGYSACPQVGSVHSQGSPVREAMDWIWCSWAPLWFFFMKQHLFSSICLLCPGNWFVIWCWYCFGIYWPGWKTRGFKKSFRSQWSSLVLTQHRQSSTGKGWFRERKCAPFYEESMLISTVTTNSDEKNINTVLCKGGLAKDQPFCKIFLTLPFYDIKIRLYLYNMTTYL